MTTEKKQKIKFSAIKISLIIGLIIISCHFCIEVPLFSVGPLSQQGFIHELELKFLDIKFLNRAHRLAKDKSRIPEPKVVIVAQDEKSIESYGLLPWSRTVMADLVNSLNNYGAKTISFDIVFSEPDRNSSYQIIRNFESQYKRGISRNKVTIGTLTSGLSEADSDIKNLLDEYEKWQKQISQNAKKLRKKASEDKKFHGDYGAKELETISKNLKQKITKLKESHEKLESLSQNSVVLQGYLTNYESKLAEQVASMSPDVAFAKAIQNTPNVILGYFCFNSQEEMSGISPEEQKQDINRIKSSTIEAPYIVKLMGDQLLLARYTDPDVIKNLYLTNLCEAVGVQSPLDVFSEATPYKGYFNATPDFDGPLRRTIPLKRLDNMLLPSLSLKSAALYLDKPIQPILSENDPTLIDGIALGSMDNLITLDKMGALLINYYINPQDYFPIVSAVDVINGTVDPSVLKDKMVIVGATAIGTMDQRVTPFSSFTPGVYVNAMSAQNIVDNRYLERPIGWALLEYIFIILLAVFLGFILKKIPVYAGGFATIGIMILAFLIDMFISFDHGYWSHIILPMIQCLLTYIVITIYRFLTEEREKKQIRNAFQLYLSKSVVDEILQDTSKLHLSGEKKELTVLFSDIRGFTTISEGLKPEELANLLNEYLSPMTEIVFDYDGTLDKYMGDAIMAFFGAPVSYEDHALRGCQVALAMMDKLHQLQKGWAERGLPIIDIGIGLNTGNMSVGNMGSNIRFDYTVMGDNVNLGSRLEGINKQYKTNIVISEFTYRAAGDGIYARELDAVRVKGKKEPVTIYELRGLGKAPESEGLWISRFEEGLSLYKNQNWDEAIARFKELQLERPEDYPCQLYIDRCEHMKLNPPGEDWDGVCTMTTK